MISDIVDSLLVSLTNAGLTVIDGPLDEYISGVNSAPRVVAVSEDSADLEVCDSPTSNQVMYQITVSVYCNGDGSVSKARTDLVTALQAITRTPGFIVKSWTREKDVDKMTTLYTITSEVEAHEDY